MSLPRTSRTGNDLDDKTGNGENSSRNATENAAENISEDAAKNTKSKDLTPRVLLSGGAGFIGSHLARALIELGSEVHVVDNFDPFYPRKLKERNIEGILGCSKVALERSAEVNKSALKVYEIDICNYEALISAFGNMKFDVFVHLAAKAGVRPSIMDPIGYCRTNVLGTQNMLELAAKTGTKQFVFASSSSVYGVNPNVPWKENEPLKPISPYAGTKIAGELMGHVYSHLYGIRFIALRYFTVYGPGQRPDLAICKFSHLMVQGKPIPFYGDGSTKRDYTYIADIVKGTISAMEYRDSMYEVINLGNHHTVSLKEMVEVLARGLGVRPILDVKPLPPGDVPQTYADIGKARRLLGYEPTTTFEEGIAKFVEWFKMTFIKSARSDR
ncbi:GDP-mannose 4,6-dehydratase [Acetomicrobium sp. S15 = DSM 107314]|uniref:GDP-mannose 4,6-dehydratase n=1 Tax=Acetomicrobium sp. S15 = DSM 107314 TaxID=2529858 RepID=UPI0031598CAA